MTKKSAPGAVDFQQLPMWPQELRGLPNAFARSALFSVGNLRAGPRKFLKRHPLAALSGINIVYTGEQLRQDDEDVFLQILHIGRMQELGTEVRFTAASMITELGWSRNTKSHKRLADCLDRMTATSIAVTVERNGSRENFTGSLIRMFRWKEQATDSPMRQWVILLEKEIISLFNPGSYSKLDWRMRLALPPMAKSLHSFFITHLVPFPMKVATFHSLMASEINHMGMFRVRLKEALRHLVECGFLVGASIDPHTDNVVVERNKTTPRLD